MAFFELLKRKWQDIGDLFKPIAARGTGGYYPSPDCHAEGADNYMTSPVQTDSAGNLMTRGPVMTDEESFRDDFPGTSLFTSLTGSLTFQAGSNEVTGSGTSFLQELNRECYIKLDAHDNTHWVRVVDIIDDNHLELEEDYATSGSGASSKSFFVPVIGTGGSIAVASSNCTIASGTTSGAETRIERWGDYGPMMFFAMLSISQRIANQEFHCGFVDDPASPGARAEVVFDGTSNTQVKFRTASGSAASAIEESTVLLPNGVTTASIQTYEVTVTPSMCYLTVDGVEVASHRRHIPGPYDALVQHAGWYNTGVPGSSTNAVVDTWFLQNQDRVEISDEFRGTKIPVSIKEDSHYLSGTLATSATTPDQVIVQYTVPAGKYLFIVGWNAASYSSTINGRPVKLGKGALTETASPGALDGLVLRSIYLNNETTYTEEFLTPRYFAAGGETVKIAVTPDGATNTTWRASLDFVLR